VTSPDFPRKLDFPPPKGKIERRKVQLIYMPFDLLPFDATTICQNPELVTGRKDSLCIPRGDKCKILHCWISKGEKESEWLRSELHYLVEIEHTPSKGVCSANWWKKWWSGFVYKMIEDSKVSPIITATSSKHLESVRSTG